MIRIKIDSLILKESHPESLLDLPAESPGVGIDLDFKGIIQIEEKDRLRPPPG